MIYILRNSGNEIVSFSDSPFTLAAGQTQETADGTLADYEARFVVTVDRPTIAADGVDTATVTVSVAEAPASVDVLVNETLVSVPLAGGVGALTIRADMPGDIHVQPADRTQYSAAGRGSPAIQEEAKRNRISREGTGRRG